MTASMPTLQLVESFRSRMQLGIPIEREMYLAVYEAARRGLEADAQIASPAAPDLSAPPLRPGMRLVPVEPTEDFKALYYDLIMQVGNKHPGESRHDTAKRYILRAEDTSNIQAGQAARQEPAK